MKPADNINNLFENSKITVGPDVDKKILNKAMSALPRQAPQPVRNSWSIIMHSRITKPLAAAIVIILGLVFFNTNDSTLYAQVIKAMEKAKTVHAIGYGLHDGKMIKTNEIWYKRDSGLKIVWKHNGCEKILIDNGLFCWNYQQGQNFAGKRKSISTKRLPKELTETHRYLEKCTKDRIESIHGVPCRLYIGSYPTKPDSTRLMYWVDNNLWPRRFEEKVLENNTWKTIELIEIKYDSDIEISVFKPNFGADVEIIDEAEILDDNFSLENAIFTKEGMDLIFAVHEVQKCQNDLIFTVTSLRPNKELEGKFASKGITAWNYGDYQFGSCFERLNDKGHHTSYSPIELGWFYRDGLVIRWTVFIPHGFEPEQLDTIRLELYYLYAMGSWGAQRKAAGLEDRIRINPIAELPLPDDSVSLENQLNKTYNLLKLLEPFVAEKHLVLKPIPFTNEEMQEYIKEHPESGETREYRAGDRSDEARLSHGQSKKPSQISFEDWLEDRLAYIEKFQNQ